ncbi:hypothetical protein DTO021D3_5711 [Paecilomyces variotii]|nr:hypothetical protein DTO032I3_5295 [Paecilomyces variotii]KAJ9277461.1 hypothetical protein DTO021D3_5711 [Paecilomyces variotii]KAJ9339136.1 hypothetical protein DTO027B6_8302 [Paecilomyces variotii]KAJ9393552.1 hypothetical protein DTO032I4_323 [Paecilomyces variotii]KAJ9410539.1 hypothetical protein DTO045G8_2002 [Paecilomyces variotii]
MNTITYSRNVWNATNTDLRAKTRTFAANRFQAAMMLRRKNIKTSCSGILDLLVLQNQMHLHVYTNIFHLPTTGKLQRAIKDRWVKYRQGPSKERLLNCPLHDDSGGDQAKI